MATYSTTVISANAFKDNTLLKTAVANSVLSVEDSAFEGCNKLQDVQLDSCTDIQDYAFQNCTSLRRVKADNVKTIGNYAFTKTVGLSSYDFPNCETVGNCAFKCEGYTTTFLANKRDAVLRFPKCKEIGDFAFQLRFPDGGDNLNLFSKMSVLDFPECERIGQWAFHVENNDSGAIAYSGLSSLNFPKCKEIGDFAFAQGLYSNGDIDESSNGQNSFLRTLTSLNFPECEKIGQGAFKHCNYENKSRPDSLKEIRFPKCREIGDQAFKQCTDIVYTTHQIGRNISAMQFDKCEKVGANAFQLFKTNKGIDLNMSSCLSVGDGAFANSNFLSLIDLRSCRSIGADLLKSATVTISSIDLPSIEKIGNENFMSLACNDLSSISFGPSLSSFGYRNFDLISRRSIMLSVSEDNPYFEVDYGSNILYSRPETDPKGKGLIEAHLLTQNLYEDDIDYIRSYAAYNSDAVLSIKSPTCKSIALYAFYMCKKLSSAEFDSVSAVGDWAFAETDLTSLSLPECLSVGKHAFGIGTIARTVNIAAISLPKCEYVGDYAFSWNKDITYSNYNFTNVYLPNCLSIGYRAFTDIKNPANCRMHFGQTIPKLIKTNGAVDAASNIATYIKPGTNIYTPPGKSAEYKAAWGSQYSYHEDEDESGMTSYGGYLYKGDAPDEGQATILKMKLERSLIEEHAQIPEVIPEEN